jgi:hypothetical protein
MILYICISKEFCWKIFILFIKKYFQHSDQMCSIGGNHMKTMNLKYIVKNVFIFIFYKITLT